MLIDLDKGIKILSEKLAKQELIIFVGSGISVDSGLPTWEGFLEKFIDMAESLPLDGTAENELKKLAAASSSLSDFPE